MGHTAIQMLHLHFLLSTMTPHMDKHVAQWDEIGVILDDHVVTFSLSYGRCEWRYTVAAFQG